MRRSARAASGRPTTSAGAGAPSARPAHPGDRRRRRPRAAAGRCSSLTGDDVFGGGTFTGLGVFRTTDGGADLAARRGRARRRARLRARGRPDEPERRLRRDRRRPVPLDRRRRDLRQRQAAHGRERRRRRRATDRRTQAAASWPTWSPTSSSRRPTTPRQRRRHGRRRGRLARGQQGQSPTATTRVAQQRHLRLRRPASPGRSRDRREDGLAADQRAAGRSAVELGVADGPDQDHDYLYAIVQDAAQFNGGVGHRRPRGRPRGAVTTASTASTSPSDFGADAGRRWQAGRAAWSPTEPAPR